MSIERREVHTKVYKSSGRTSSQQNLSEFDNNLDHLLEDLQSSVSRPGSSLGNAYTETRTVTYGSKGDSLGRVQYMQASNPITTVSDDTYNYKPAGQKSIKTYKTESYSTYNTGTDVPDNVRMQNNINKLDTLLDDLQQVRKGGTLDKNDHGHKEMKLLYNDKITDERRTRSGSISREIELNAEGTYGKPIRQPSPSRNQGVTRQVHEYKYVDHAKAIPSNATEIVTVDDSINPKILAQLDPTLLPSGNTKVTTTIKTYTYEIPGTGYPQAVSPKLNETVFSSNPSTPSKSFSYNKIENHSTHNVSNTGSYPGDYIRPASPQPVGFKKNYVESTTTRNVTDTYGKPSPTPIRNKENYVYNETRTNEYTHGYPSPPPTTKHINVYKETTTKRDNYNNGYPNNNYPTNKTYIINETHTTRNINGHPNTETFDPKRGPPNDYPKDPRDVNITYKYTTHHTSSNSYKGHPNEEMDPLLHTPPFPTDGNDGPDAKGPPKRLEELMAEFGNEPPNNQYNAGYNARQAELAVQKKESKEVEETQKKDFKDMPKSKNVAGPPVYYPPNHEMFAHKEESAGGYRAEGGMMKESGKYKYEAKSSSKSKERSGVAVVPVCLPLCCGLPCAIL